MEDKTRNTVSFTMKRPTEIMKSRISIIKATMPMEMIIKEDVNEEEKNEIKNQNSPPKENLKTPPSENLKSISIIHENDKTNLNLEPEPEADKTIDSISSNDKKNPNDLNKSIENFSLNKNEFNHSQDQNDFNITDKDLKPRHTVSNKNTFGLFDSRMKMKGRKSFIKIQSNISSLDRIFENINEGKNGNVNGYSTEYSSRTLNKNAYSKIKKIEELKNEDENDLNKQPERGVDMNKDTEVLEDKCLLTEEDLICFDKTSSTAAMKPIKMMNVSMGGMSADDYNNEAPQSKAKKGYQSDRTPKNLDDLYIKQEQMKQNDIQDEDEPLLCNCDAKCLIF